MSIINNSTTTKEVTAMTSNTAIPEDEKIRRAIEGEADWLNGAEFDEFSIEDTEIEESDTTSDAPIDTTDSNARRTNNMLNSDANTTTVSNTDIVIVKDYNKINSVFTLATSALSYKQNTLYRNKNTVLNTDDIERDVADEIIIFNTAFQIYVSKHPLDLVQEELMGLYLKQIYIVYNEASFFKWESVLRLMYNLKI